MRPNPRPRPFLRPALERVWLSERRPRPVEAARAWLGVRIIPGPARAVCARALEAEVAVQPWAVALPPDPQDQARRIVAWARERGVPVQLVPAPSGPMFSAGFPHCDAQVLHAPGECQHCDTHPEWQDLRVAWGVAFTGQYPAGGVVEHRRAGGADQDRRSWSVPWPPSGATLPCPADFRRPPGSESDHRRWAGNVATSAHPVNESAASRALYDVPRGDSAGH